MGLQQVLHDEELREKYNKKGKAGLADEKMVDGTAFFAMLFGSEQFDHLIGRTKVT
jgi:DnaJ-class molecular chaperone